MIKIYRLNKFAFNKKKKSVVWWLLDIHNSGLQQYWETPISTSCYLRLFSKMVIYKMGSKV